MSLKDQIKTDLADYGVHDIKVERNEYRGVSGTTVELYTEDGVRHAWWFSSENKMTPEHMVTVMESYIKNGDAHAEA